MSDVLLAAAVALVFVFLAALAFPRTVSALFCVVFVAVQLTAIAAFVLGALAVGVVTWPFAALRRGRDRAEVAR